ncbi:MAG TPA: hypothetical protein EYG93_09180 [Sulfurospirillum arcachonense]|nr:hypothetical protein [Sulfurospirillum arcachonense]HIP45483.1 hypothetical protein [Sulfurospirillum arcachonense]
MIRVLIGFFIASVFVGCTTTNKNNVIYEEYKPEKSVKQVPNKQRTIKKVATIEKEVPTNGSIKGNVTKLTFSDGIWNYEVKSRDTSNQKLSIAKFTHRKKVAKKGDFVYVIIENGKLKESYLIKKANYKSKRVKKTHKKKKQYKPKTFKRTKKYQVIGVPTVESISLD